MVLQKQRLSFPLVGGLDTKTADPHVQPTKVLSLENCVFEKVGQLNKRAGFAWTNFTMYGTNKAHTGKYQLYTHRNELLQPVTVTSSVNAVPPSTDGPFMVSVDDTTNKLSRAGRFATCRIGTEGVAPAGYQNVTHDHAYTDGYRCFVWCEFILAGTPVSYCTIIDELTGTKIVDRHVLGPNGIYTPRVEVAGDKFLIFAADWAANDLYVTIVDTDTPTTFSAEAVVAADLVAAGYFDTCAATDSTHGDVAIVAYVVIAGTMKLISVDTSGTVQRTVAIATTAIDCINVANLYDRYVTDQRIMLMYQNNATNAVTYQTYDEELGAVTAATALYVEADNVRHMTAVEDPGYGIATPANSSAMIFLDTDDATNRDVKAVPARFSGAAAAVINVMPHCFLASKAFVHDNIARVVVCAVDQNGLARTQQTYFLIHQYSDADSGHTYTPWCWHTDAVFFAKRAWASVFYGQLPTVREMSGGKFELFIGKQDRLQSRDFLNWPDIGSFLVTFELGRGSTSTDNLHTDVIHTDQATHIGGGLSYAYDGRTVEHGFLMAPAISSITDAAAGGHIADGTYLYVCIYEWTDRLGQLHRSAPSVPVSHTNSAGTSTEVNTVTVKTLTFGEHFKGEAVNIRLYRTLDAGTVYYNTGEYTANNVAAATVTIADDNADATIAANATLYTTGGVLANYPPPAWTIGCLWGERLVVISDQNKRTAWISKPKVAANLGWEFSDETPMRIISPADLTAAAVMDGNLYLFTADDILQVYGTPPDSFGNANLKTRVVSHEAGCSEAGVVNIDKGLVFKSKRGIYLLGRGLQLEFIGAAVDDYASNTIIQIVKVPKKNQLFFVRAGAKDDPLVYDYLVNQWSLFSFEAPATIVTEGYCVWRDLLTKQMRIISGSTWTIYQQDSTYTDGLTESYFMKWRSAWVKTSGMQGFQRLYWIHLLAEYVAPCVLTVNVYYDYSDTASQSITWTVDAAAGADVPLQLRIKPELQKCQAVSVEVVESAPSGTNGSVKFSGLDLVIGVKGKTPLKASKSA